MINNWLARWCAEYQKIANRSPRDVRVRKTMWFIGITGLTGSKFVKHLCTLVKCKKYLFKQ